MKMKMITILFFSFLSSIASAESMLLTWAFATSTKTSLPPPTANIINPQHPLYKLFVAHLKHYDHAILEATIPRIEEEIKTKKLICYPGSSEYSRRRNFTYLTSLYVQPAPQLVVSQEIGKQLLKTYKGSIKLANIMSNPKLRGALAEGRSYGESLDRVLLNEKSNIKRQVYNTFIQTVVQQIKNGRVDFTLEYPFIVKAIEDQDSNNKVKLMTIPLSDVDQYVTQYAACSKTPEGLQVIKKIDDIVKKNIAEKSYWQGVMNSLPDQDRSTFQKQINLFIADRQKHSVLIQ